MIHHDRTADEDWFKRLFDLSPDPTWIIEGNQFVDCNEAAVSTLGYKDREEFLHVHPSKLSPPRQPDGQDSYAKAEQMMAAAKARGVHRFEWMHTKADGADFPAEVTLCAIELGAGRVIYCVWRDITERKRAEEALRQSEEWHRTILQTAMDGFWLADIEGRLLEVNDAYCKMSGYDQRELLQMRIGDLEYAESPENVAARIKRIMERGEDRFESRHRAKDGRVIDVEVSVQHRLHQGGRLVAFIRDISARRRSQAALESSEYVYRTMVSSAPEGVWMIGPDRRTTEVSEKMCQLIGYAREHMLGRNPVEFADEENARVFEEKAGLAPNPKTRTYQVALRHRDSRNIPTEFRATTLFNPDGTVLGVLAFVTDLTERKRAEKAVLDSEARFRTLVEWTPEPVLVHRELEIIYANPAAVTLFGASSPGMLEKRSILDLVHPDYHESWLARLQAVSKQGIRATPMERKLLKLDGTEFDAEVQGTQIFFDGAPAIQTTIRDLTARKQAERGLRNFRLAMDSTADGIYIVDRRSMSFIDVNAGACTMLGLTREEVLAAGPEGVLSMPRAALAQIYDAVIAREGVVEPVEVLRTRKDGSQAWIEIRRRAQRAENDWMIVTVARDITERKRAEAARAGLEAQVRESQKMEALGTLAGGVAHDFNNALAMIMGNVELARQDIGADHPALVSLDEIGKASRRARDLVQQILSFGRRQTLERKATSLALVVVETARLVRATLPAMVGLNINCESDAPAVLADATQIKQILLNLCGNATQAIQDEGGFGTVDIGLRAHMQAGPSARSNLKEGRYACLSVRDTGPGMDEATLSHIFEPFFTTKPVGKGTGLGLAVVHGIVQAHQATMEVESTPGGGSTFRIYFPAIDAPVEETTRPDAVGAPIDGAGKRVLYVDDEEAIIFLMKRLLERQGFRVSGFTDPREAVATVRANPDQFDLAVTDFNMPGMSGLAVAGALREIRADLPVVLASGYITEELRQKAPAAGVRELIYKPNTVDDLCEAVARYANAQIRPAT